MKIVRNINESSKKLQVKAGVKSTEGERESKKYWNEFRNKNNS